MIVDKETEIASKTALNQNETAIFIFWMPGFWRLIVARMRSNVILSMAQLIEETSRDNNTSFLSRAIRFALFQSLADKLWTPFRFICFSPVISLVVLVIAYLLFLVIFLPLFLISLVVTFYGSVAVFVLLLHWLAVFVARSIAFPGSNNATLKHTSADIIRRLAEYLENTAAATNEIASSFMLVASGKLASSDLNNTSYTIDQVWPAVEFFPNMNLHFKDALDNLKRDNALTVEEVRNLTQLCAGIEEFFSHFSELSRFVSIHRGLLSSSSFQSSAHQNQRQELLTLSGRCLNSSEKVRICAIALRPQGSSSDEDSSNSNSSDFNLAQLKQLFAFASGVTGYEKVSFPYMRSILVRKHHAVPLQLRGANDYSLDGILLPSSANIHDRNRLGKRLVFFCGPNAAFYEGIAQYHNFEQSWFGFYLSLGFDVFVYNYRGYGRSQGSPTPSALKRDALCLLQYIQRLYKTEIVLVHGESIGGMIACHLAAHYSPTKTNNDHVNDENIIRGLIVDRSFSSLDDTASRLLGNWAGLGLRLGAAWSTHTVTDYLAVRCPKLLMQDPDDEIIADPSSLRAGVSRAMFIRSSTSSATSDRPSEHNAYIIARYEMKPLPNRQVAFANQLLLSQSSSITLSRGGEALPWSPILWEHFHACCRHILELVAESLMPPLTSTASSSPPHGNDSSSNKSNLQSPPLLLGQIEMMQRQGGHATTTTTTNNNILVVDGPVDLINDNGGDEVKIEMMESESSTNATRRLPLTMLSQTLAPSSSSTRESTTSTTSANISHRQRYEQRQQFVLALTRRRYVQKVISISMHDSSAFSKPLHAYQKAWIAICRVDNGCGQCLGAAIGSRGWDGLQTFLQALLCFGHDQLRIDSVNTDNGPTKIVREGLQRAVNDLRQLQQNEAQLANDEAIHFLEKAFSLLITWHEHFSSNNNSAMSEFESDVESSSQSPHRSYGSLDALQQRCPQQLLDRCPVSASSIGSSHLDRKMMGKLLPLACGHNGWPASNELESLKLWLRQTNIISNT